MNIEIKNILASWESSLTRYGKIDNWNFSENLSLLGRYLRANKDENKNIHYLIKYIRDTVITKDFNTENVLNAIHKVMKLEEENTKSTSICFLAKRNKRRVVLNGQEVRFKSETQKLFTEKLKFKNGELLRNFDIETESCSDSRKVRRIVEKRMSQAYHKMNRHEEGYKTTNNERYWMKRATAFQLHNIGQKEKVRNVTRGLSTHWKKQYDPLTHEIVFKKKMAYRNEAAALKAIEEWKRKYPKQRREMAAYQCSDCGKWHIGHKANLLAHPMLNAMIPHLQECC